MFSFLNSGILVLTSAVVVPLLIYLFAKKKPHKIIFSSIRFIKQSQQNQRRKINLKNILLLIIRMLIILLTILAISRPAIRSNFLKESTKHPKTAVAIIVDNSYSMNYLVDTQTELEKAKQICRQINDILTQDDVSMIFTLDRDWNSVNSRLNYGKLSEQIINNITITTQNQPLPEVVTKAYELVLEAQLPNRECYIITDRQNYRLPDDLKIPTFVIPTSNILERNNISCQNAVLQNRIVKKDLQKVIEFELVNHSAHQQNDVVYQLFLDGNTVAEKAAELLPDQVKKLQFTIDIKNGGWHSGYVQVKNERQTFDNKNHFSFLQNLNPAVAVLTDQAELSLTLQSILSVYSNQIELITSNNINFELLESYDNVIIYRKIFDEKIEFILNKFLQEGRGLIFLTDENISPRWQSFFAESFQLKFGSFDKDRRSIDQINEFHPITQLLKEAGSIEIRNIWQVKANNNVNVLLQSQTEPLLIEKDKSLLWLLDLDNIQNPFTLQSAFPVLFYNSLKFTSGETAASLTVGDKLQLNSAEITLPDGDKLSLNNNFYVVENPGIYHTSDHLIAVNLDYSESEFELMKEHKQKNLTFCSENWQGEILQSRYGFELWKYLLLAVLILIALEMIIVKTEERKLK